MLTNCRLTIDGQVDTYSVPNIVRDVVGPLGDAATVEAKVMALYHWVRRALFVFANNSPGDLQEDYNKALKIINWWGFGLCGTHAKVFGTLVAELLGPANVRLVGLREREPGSWKTETRGARAFIWSQRARDVRPYGGQGHTSLEVFWDGHWHFLDVMVGFYARRDPGGRIVGIDELIGNRTLVESPVGNPEGDMPYGAEPEIFCDSNVLYKSVRFNHWPGEPMPLNLRPGERFTWLAEPMAGAYYLHPQVRHRYGSDALAPGPRGHRPDRPVPTYGNGEHVLDVTLRPADDDPFYRRQSNDWSVPVELPYPVLSLHWRTEPEGTGFLHFPASTGDELVALKPIGSHYLPESATPGRSYRLILRAPDGHVGPVRLACRTIVQLNRLVVPQLEAGENTVRLAAEGEGELRANVGYRLDGEERTVELAGVGEYRVAVPATGEVAPGSITLANPI